MPARSAARSPSPSAKPSFIDRLKKPFGPKARLFSSFFIQPDDPHRVYGPGDVITGSVVLKVTKPFTVTHIVVCLHGYAQVYKTPNSPGEQYKNYSTNLASGRTRKAGGYYGNGFMSLFEDEITLCGDGRLGEGTYQFNFELIFPREHLPSSIEFERGTVSYMITATLTRPTTLAPTSICDRKISFQEDIDVAPLSQPKPRMITLEPLPRRTRPKQKMKRRSTSGTTGTAATAATVESSANSTADSERTATEVDAIQRVETQDTDSQFGGEEPRSPMQSDASISGYVSSSGDGTSSAIDSAAPSTRTCQSKHNSSHTCARCQKRPITTTISIERAGILRGDVITVRVCLTHTKAIRSLRGVIVTLYRQARVDLQPALPTIRHGEEDGAARTRTGLSSLSLSSAGSTHTYRKDLDQQFASLIVNPTTMQAELKVNLRVPEEAFPSIASVPGAMISFKYYVEVVVDIQGKLASLDKYLPTANPIRGDGNRADDGNASNYAPLNGEIINTEEIRRERSVIFTTFEVVVGTRDSDRRSNWKQPELEEPAATGPEVEQSNGAGASSAAATPGANNAGNDGRQLSWDQYWRHHPPTSPHPDDQPPPMPVSPPPPIEDESHLTEKERMQRAEARLLPSAPPEAAESSSNTQAYAPSAPNLHDDRPLPPLPPMSPPAFENTHAGPSAPPAHALDNVDHGETSAPAYDHENEIGVPITDDKEDMRRRELEAARSAPPGAEDDALAGALQSGTSAPSASLAPSAPSAPSFDASAPSAPTFDEDDHFGFSASSSSHHALPRYER